MKKILLRAAIFSLTSLLSLCLGGCADDSDTDSDQPWAQPASWEQTPAAMRAMPGGMPGMGG